MQRRRQPGVAAADNRDIRRQVLSQRLIRAAGQRGIGIERAWHWLPGDD
jgi:hypothetical protein